MEINYITNVTPELKGSVESFLRNYHIEGASKVNVLRVKSSDFHYERLFGIPEGLEFIMIKPDKIEKVFKAGDSDLIGPHRFRRANGNIGSPFPHSQTKYELEGSFFHRLKEGSANATKINHGELFVLPKCDVYGVLYIV
ncbi:MAG: hypothetical protein AABW50_05270 [Nanoarchaeota archaeon]